GLSSAVTFTVDTASPAVVISTPAGGSSTSDTTPTFGGAAGDAAGDSATVTVKVYSGSTATGTPVQTLTATRSGTSCAVAAPTLGGAPPTVNAEPTGPAAHPGLSAAVTFTVDTTAPTVNLTTPSNGASINDSTPTFAGTAGDAAGDSATVTVKV